MRIWLISDSHMLHAGLNVPEVDMVIHAGDAANNRSPGINNNELRAFLSWYKELSILHKIFIPGNHDTSLQAGLVKKKEIIAMGIKCLIDEHLVVDHIKIFGSPFTPSFGVGWAYNADRGKIHKHWDMIDKDTDIVVTHGPPHSILDITVNRDGYYEQSGCKALFNKMKIIQPKVHVFGHFHKEKLCSNAGEKTIQKCKTRFINASVADLKYNLNNNGHIIDI